MELKYGISSRLDKIKSRRTLIISIFFDPRFKTMAFANKQLTDQAKTLITIYLSVKLPPGMRECIRNRPENGRGSK
jgi:hypothetical protein